MRHIRYIPAKTGKNAVFFLMCAAVAFGVFIGSLPFVADKGMDTPLLHQFFSPHLCGNTVFSILYRTSLSALLYLAAVFLLGAFAFGQPASTALLIYRGIGIGVSVYSLYRTAGMRSMPAVIVLILPLAVGTVFVSVLAVRESVRSSNRLLKAMTSDNSGSHERSGLKMYCIRFAVLLLISFVISVADSLMNYVFADLL